MNDEDERKAEAFANAAVEGGIIYDDKVTHPSQITEVKDARVARLEALIDELSLKEGTEGVIRAVRAKIRRIEEGDRMLLWMNEATHRQLKDHCQREAPVTLPTMDDLMGTAGYSFMGWAIWIDNWIEPGQIEFSTALTKHGQSAGARQISLMAAAAKFDELMRRDL